ncbi:MAG: hypothetical protein WB424_01295 [Terracidiphilus sp.]
MNCSLPRMLFALLLALIAPAAAGAQQASQNSPSLAFTMRYIQQNAVEGRLTYTADVIDSAQSGAVWRNSFTAETSNLTADAPSCRLTYHWRTEVNGSVTDDADYTLPLREVGSVQVVPQDKNQALVDSRTGHPQWTSRVSPFVYALVASRSGGVENVFLFSSEETAYRVAKAMRHAVELCASGKDTF